jgi:hypothetical protein
MLLDSAPPGLDRLDSRVDDGVAGEKLRVLLAKDDVSCDVLPLPSVIDIHSSSSNG